MTKWNSAYSQSNTHSLSRLLLGFLFKVKGEKRENASNQKDEDALKGVIDEGPGEGCLTDDMLMMRMHTIMVKHGWKQHKM